MMGGPQRSNSPFGMPFTVDDKLINEGNIKLFLALHKDMQSFTPAERKALRTANCEKNYATDPLCMKVTAIALKHGYGSGGEVTGTSFKVIRAYMYLRYPIEMAQIKEGEPQMKAALSNPDVPESYKGMMKQAYENLQKMKAPDADIKTVTPYKVQLDGVFADYEKWSKE